MRRQEIVKNGRKMEEVQVKAEKLKGDVWSRSPE